MENVFAFLADQESEDAFTIVALKAAEEEKKNAKAKAENKKKNYVRGGGGRGKEGHGNDVDQRYNGHQGNGRPYGRGNGYGTSGYGRGNGYFPTKGNARDNGRFNINNGQANVSYNGWRTSSIQQDNNRRGNRRARVTEIGVDQLFENEEVLGSDGGNQKHEAVNSPINEVVKGSDGGNQEHEAVNSHGNEVVKGSDGDNQEHEAVNLPATESQGNVSVGTEVPSKEELPERTKLSKEEEEHEARKQKWLAKQKEREEEMRKKTLKEYEKQLAEKKALSGPETQMRKVTLDKELESMQVLLKEKKDNIYPTQKSKDEIVKKDSNIDKDGKVVYKTMSIEEFWKLPTASEGHGGPDRNENSRKNANGGETGRGRGRISMNHGGTGRGRGDSMNANRGGTGRGRNGDSKNNVNVSPAGTIRGRSGDSKNAVTENQESAPPVEDNTVKVKAGPAPELSETSFPVLSKATKPRKT